MLISTSMELAIPEEIWAETLVHLPRADLPQVNLTHKTFYRIGRPLLFRDFEFHPYLCLAGFTRCPPAGLVIPEAEYTPPLLQRLQFWSGPDIAPFVRTCRVTRWSREGARTIFRAWDPTRADSDPYILLSAFFNTLPRFTVLRLLVFADIRFTQLGLLHNLDVLELNMCSVAHGEVADTRELTPLHVSQFTFQHEGRPDTCFDHWVPLLNPQILTHLELACNASVLLGGNIFPCVKHLKITLNLSLPWTRILSNFPTTEVLNISSSRCSGEVSDPHLPLDELLPTLREYSGPEELLQFLVPIPTLRRVSVLQWTAGIFDNITAQLEGLAETNNVTSV